MSKEFQNTTDIKYNPKTERQKLIEWLTKNNPTAQKYWQLVELHFNEYLDQEITPDLSRKFWEKAGFDFAEKI